MDEKLEEFRQKTSEELRQLMETILNGWPQIKSHLPKEVKQHWQFREQIDYVDGILYKGDRNPSVNARLCTQVHPCLTFGHRKV